MIVVAEKVGHRLVSDVSKYEAALEDLIEADPEQYRALTQLARSVGNRGPLKKHSIVEVEIAGSLTRARVEEEVGGGEMEVALSLWKMVHIENQPYEEGYDTSLKSVSIFPRDQIIAVYLKTTQHLTDATVEAAIKNSSTPVDAAARIRDPARPEFLVALYCDAHASRQRMLQFAEAAKIHIAKASDDTAAGATRLATIVPELKGLLRTCVKTAEKYGGRYDKITDLCRMTFLCATVEMAMRVITFIHDHPGWAVIRIKDRLDAVFDASSTGGYRDLLINARDVANGHIVELQLTFTQFYQIKTRGGHAVYKLARLLELNERETTHFEGTPDDETLERISKGILRTLKFTSVPSDIHDALLTERGLLSKTCAVTQYRAERIEQRGGQELDLTRVLPLSLLHHIGINLTQLEFSICHLVGNIPETIGEYCVNLRYLIMLANQIEGEIPQNFANLKKLQVVKLGRTKLSGSWDVFSQLRNLQNIWLFKTKISGPIPTNIGNCAQLKELSLSNTPIKGVIPESIGKCTQLQVLKVFNTQMSGPIPETIGQCRQLNKILMYNTQISGPLPQSIGNLTQLQNMCVYKSQISGAIPDTLCLCENLQKLRLDDTKLSGVVPPSIVRLTNLTLLALDNTDVVRPEGLANHKMWVEDDPKGMREFLAMFKQS